MKKKTLQAVVIALGILSSSFTVSAMGKTNAENAVLPEITEENTQNQDVETDGNAEQTELDVLQTKLEEDGGTDSKLEYGWIEDEKGYQYKEENGNLLKDGWWEIEGERYYFDKDGYRASYWQYIDGKYYWFGNNGKMQTGWQEIWGKKYYLGPDGAMQTYWSVVDGEYYWFGPDGAMRTGWQEIWGKYYYLGNDGVMQTYWSVVDGKYYWLGLDGAMRTDWQEIWGKYYYLGNDGAMNTYWSVVDGEYYWFGPDGAMRTGWQQVWGKYYYLGSDGVMQTYWSVVDGKYYWLGPDGAMRTGWQEIWGKWYYLDIVGAMQTGWIWTEGDRWYYTYDSGVMASNCWEKINGYWYWFDESGLMAQGWKYIGRYKYYFAQSGYMLQDLDGILGRQSSYEITVNRKKCQVMVYAKDGSNGYIIPVKTFTCSVGLPSTPTPTGTFYTPDKYRWHTLMGPSYGQYCTRINGGILFHSVAGYNMTSYNIYARDYNKLGSPASHGCVRLNVRDAKWIYDNCSLGTKVTISDSMATPFDKPATIKIPANQHWDPTDPNI